MADAPYLSMQRFTGNGTTTDWTVNFAGNTPSNENWYIEADDIEAIEVIPATALAAEVRIERTVTRIGPSQFRVTPAVASGRILVLRRKTENRFNLVDFQSLQAVSEYDLDLANKQLLFVTQEASDQARLAEDRAFEAETVAYSSVNVSTEALTTANSANTKATTALNTSNEASLAADNAVATANAANSTADSANSTANTALSTANGAVTTANTAYATATSADGKANTAIATANSAVDTAVAAAADASAALTASEQAELAASAAQSSAAAAESLAAVADANAATALSTANGIDAKATEALDTANAASVTATQAMTLIGEAGVSTFNGRAGVVMPLAGDYSSAQVTHGDSTVATKLDGHDVSLSELAGRTAAVEAKNTAQDTVIGSKLNAADGVAYDSARLGGKLASSYATDAELAAAVAQRQPLGSVANKNYIINAGMHICQRYGTARARNPNGGYVIDRWMAGAVGTAGTYDASQATGNVAGLDYNASYCFRIEKVSGSPTAYYMRTRLERVNLLTGTVTVSAYVRWARGSAANLTCGLTQNFGTGGSAPVVVNATANAARYPSGGDMQRFSWTFNLPSLEGKTYGPGNYLEVVFYANSPSSGFIWDLTNVKLEQGSIATPYEKEDNVELAAKCFRYYCRFLPNDWNTQAPADGYLLARYTALPVAMRTIPTITHNLNSPANAFGVNVASLQINMANSTEIRWLIYTTAVGNGWFTFNVNNFIACDAEL